MGKIKLDKSLIAVCIFISCFVGIYLMMGISGMYPGSKIVFCDSIVGAWSNSYGVSISSKNPFMYDFRDVYISLHFCSTTKDSVDQIGNWYTRQGYHPATKSGGLGWHKEGFSQSVSLMDSRIPDVIFSLDILEFADINPQTSENEIDRGWEFKFSVSVKGRKILP